MNRLWTWLFLGASIPVFAQQPAPTSPQNSDVMLAAVSRDVSMLSGGIGPGKWTGRGTVVVEPLARLKSSGEWSSLPCGKDAPKTCPKFAREYLSKPHTYTVVSADGQGATVHAAPTTLDECYFYSGKGTYSDASVAKSAIAASSSDFFADSAPPRLLDNEESRPIRKALATLVPRKLDSVGHLRIFSLRLEGQDMFVVQRAFTDMGTVPDNGRLKFIFALGTVDQGRFHILHRKQNSGDENERVLGTIHLKSGRDFLITVVNDPEGQWFRVYGMKNRRLTLIYSGGGSSC